MRFFKKIPPRVWVILLLFVIIASFSYLRIFNNYELLFYDLRFQLRPPIESCKDIVIIEIADDTLKNLGKWPLPRDFHASLINVLKEFDVKSVAFDILFSEMTLYDEAFSHAIKEAENVYFPIAFYIKTESKDKLSPPISDTILGDISSAFKPHIAGYGHINVFVDGDGKIRKMPLFVQYEDDLFANLALKLFCDSNDLDTKNVEFLSDRVVIDDKLTLPTREHSSFLVNYPDKWDKAFEHISYFEILKSYHDLKKGKTPKVELSKLKGKICFIGLTATGTSDIRAIPLESNYPMLGLQASVLNSLINNRFIKDAGRNTNTLINLLIFTIILIICLKISPLKSLIASIGFALVYFFVSLLVFIIYGLWIDLFLPLFIIALTWGGATLYGFFVEVHKRQLLEKELDIARKIQKSFLPQEIGEFLDIEVLSFMQPAKFVAGDLYDIVTLDEKRIGVFIGDVSGKGVSASLIMAQTVSLFRVFAKNNDDPSDVLTKLNVELANELKGQFVTALYIIVDTQTRKIKASCAGHSPIIFYNANDSSSTELLPVSGPPLGVLGGIDYENFEQVLTKNDRFLLYTDGVTEARDKTGQEFGETRLKELLLKDKDSLSSSTLADLKDELFKFCRGLPQHDDITIILLNVKN
jgi:CHASE2 domain-containing sensor protein